MLALIAGTGDLPTALVARLGTRPVICAMAGSQPQLTPELRFRLEHLGNFLQELRARGVTEVCMAGAVTRPAVDAAQISAETKPFVPRIMAALTSGDDAALRAVISIFEETGFAVLAAHELAPDLVPQAGVLTRTPVPDMTRTDAVLGEETLAEMGAKDSGQACLVRQGRVLAREDQGGTDAMIRRLTPPTASWDPIDLAGGLLGDAAEWLSGPDGAPSDARGAILFKGPKPDQDRRADLPVIGKATAKAAVAAGLSGIVVEAGGVMVLDLPEVIATLDAAGAFLWVRPKGGA